MKPSKNAFIGYTYQQYVTYLFLAKMDVERTIDKIEIEAEVQGCFEDLILSKKEEKFAFQIKDCENVHLKDLNFRDDSITIKSKKQKLSKWINILVFKNIDIPINQKMFGLDCYSFKNIFIISISRNEIDKILVDLYKSTPFRASIMQSYLNSFLDKRKFLIQRSDLPLIETFNVELQEKTIEVESRTHNINQILVIEGKPGIGKSHYVNYIQKLFKKTFLYRFWVSEHDKFKDERLKYDRFISDISKKLFHDFRDYSELQIIEKLKINEVVFIIDGLDHVENYRSEDLNKFIHFIDQLKNSIDTIILTRPLLKKISWEKFTLTNWNLKQTRLVLEKLYHISDYSTAKKIFIITRGYPILIRFLATHYKKTKVIPDYQYLEDINDYYEKIVNKEKGLRALSIFLCSRSYFMKSEIPILIDTQLAEIVLEYIEEHPYLFDIKLNRVSLFHDSFSTFLRKKEINYDELQKRLNELISNSILSGENRFLSRISYFNLKSDHKEQILLKYSSIEEFEHLMNGCIDFESIRDFYLEIREWLNKNNFKKLSIHKLYNLALILNIISRDHISHNHAFLYTYINCLLKEGIDENSITSQGYLFGMLFYVKTGNSNIIRNLRANNHFDTNKFHEELENDLFSEISFFKKYNEELTDLDINKILKNTNCHDPYYKMVYLLSSLYINKSKTVKYSALLDCVKAYFSGDVDTAIDLLTSFSKETIVKGIVPHILLSNVKNEITSLGINQESENYKNLSLKDFILKNKLDGSFDLCEKVHRYLRLSLHLDRDINILEISCFWLKYYNRKDYSFINVHNVLLTLEFHNYINEKFSIDLIDYLQKNSEKGMRYSLNEYLEQKPPEIIDFLTQNYNFEDLRVYWFELPTEHINRLPINIFNYELNEKIKAHDFSRLIDFKEIKNVLSSNRAKKLSNELTFFRYSINVEKPSKADTNLLAKFNLSIKLNQKETILKSSPETYLEGGIIDIENKHLIKKLNLSPSQVASFSDRNYSALSDLELYNEFSKQEIKTELKQIIYNSISTRRRGQDYFLRPFHLVGNIPKLISYYDSNFDLSDICKSFLTYLDLSLVKSKNVDKGV